MRKINKPNFSAEHIIISCINAKKKIDDTDNTVLSRLMINASTIFKEALK